MLARIAAVLTAVSALVWSCGGHGATSDASCADEFKVRGVTYVGLASASPVTAADNSETSVWLCGESVTMAAIRGVPRRIALVASRDKSQVYLSAGSFVGSPDHPLHEQLLQYVPEDSTAGGCKSVRSTTAKVFAVSLLGLDMEVGKRRSRRYLVSVDRSTRFQGFDGAVPELDPADDVALRTRACKDSLVAVAIRLRASGRPGRAP